jgi:hypothetical protein
MRRWPNRLSPRLMLSLLSVSLHDAVAAGVAAARRRPLRYTSAALPRRCFKPTPLELQRATADAMGVHRRSCKAPRRILPAPTARAAKADARCCRRPPPELQRPTTELQRPAADATGAHRRSCEGAEGPRRMLPGPTSRAAKGRGGCGWRPAPKLQRTIGVAPIGGRRRYHGPSALLQGTNYGAAVSGTPRRGSPMMAVAGRGSRQRARNRQREW